MRNKYKIILLIICVFIIGMLAGCHTEQPAETEKPTVDTTVSEQIDETQSAPTEPIVETTEPSTEATEPDTETTVPADPGDIGNGGVPETPGQTEAPAEPKPTEHQHNYTSKVTEPTCENKGYTTHTCACGDSYEDNETKATGHDYETKTVVPTESSEGYDVHTCKNCGKSYLDNYTDKIAAPTEHKHNYKTETVSATCTSDGYTNHTCDCGDKYTDAYVKAKGHNLQAANIVPPTVNANGYTVYKCKNCNYTENRDFTDKLPEETVPEEPAHEHSWSAWTSTETKSSRTCTTCNETEIVDGSDAYAVTEVLNIINQYRAENGLPALSYNHNKQAFANLRAEEANIYFKHRRLDDKQHGAWECLAKGTTTAKATVDGWMASDGHRPSLLSKDATSATIARYKNCWVLLLFY